MTLPAGYDAYKLATPDYLEEASACPECDGQLDQTDWCPACDQDYGDEPDPDRYRDDEVRKKALLAKLEDSE